VTVPASTWSAGSYSVNTSAAGFARVATPDGPFDNLQLGIEVADPDGAVLALRNMHPATSGVCGAGCTGAAIGGTTKVRLGRLRLSNANGSQLIAMPLPVQAQYWNGAGFIQNTLDSCTSISTTQVALGNYQRNLNSGETVVSGGGAFSAGVATLGLSAPGAGNNGSVDVSVNLSGVPAGASCTPGMPLSTPASKAYLQGGWCGAALNRDPSARATFGVSRGSDQLIYQRENF
jgi:MSHA biogenesis protein MshQ